MWTSQLVDIKPSTGAISVSEETDDNKVKPKERGRFQWATKSKSEQGHKLEAQKLEA
jgi:hypothetical protein